MTAFPEQEPPPVEEVRRRPWGPLLVSVLLTVVALAAAGALIGLLWQAVAPTVPVINAGGGRIVVNDPAPEEYIAADGWFSLMFLVFGILAAIAGWMLLRRMRGPLLLIAVGLGCLAAPVAGWQVGRMIGLSAYEEWQASSAPGATYDAPPDLHALAVLLIPAFAAMILLTLMAGWSNDPDLDEPGARPGYGSNHPSPYDDDAVGAGPYAQPYPYGQPGPSSGWPDAPGPTAEPAPPGPGPANPPRG